MGKLRKSKSKPFAKSVRRRRKVPPQNTSELIGGIILTKKMVQSAVDGSFLGKLLTKENDIWNEIVEIMVWDKSLDDKCNCD